MTPALTSKALERVGVPPVGCAFLPIIRPLVVLSLVATYCSSCPMDSRYAAAWGSLSKTSPDIMGAGVARNSPVCPSPPTVFLPGAIWCNGWGGHQFGKLVPQLCGTLPRVSGHGSLVGINHQLRIRGPGGDVEIPDGISNVLADPMEETVFEVLLDL